MSASTTAPPERPMCCANANPSPREAPVTRTFLPSSRGLAPRAPAPEISLTVTCPPLHWRCVDFRDVVKASTLGPHYSCVGGNTDDSETDNGHEYARSIALTFGIDQQEAQAFVAADQFAHSDAHHRQSRPNAQPGE